MKTKRINIYGEIGTTTLQNVIASVSDAKDADALEIHLSSIGGNVEVGFSIYEFLKSVDKPIKMIGEGVVASIATVIFMAGDTRVIQPGTKFWIHMPLIPSLKNVTSADLKTYSTALKEVEKKVLDFYTSTTGLNREALEPMLKAETFLTEDEVLSMGFTTEKGLQLHAVAKLTIKKEEEMADKTDKKTVGLEILSQIKAFFKAEIENKMVLTAAQTEITFPDLSEDDPIVVGAKATYGDGTVPDGELVMANGVTLVFEAGVVVEITEAVVEDSEEVKSLKEGLDTVTAEKEVVIAEKEAIQAKYDEVTKILEDVQAKYEKAEATLKNIEAIQSKLVGEEARETEHEDNKTNMSKSIAAIMDL